MGRHDAIESAIANDELAARMQLAVPELMEVNGESRATRALYGMDDPYAPTRLFARNCLTARRLVERGVRFVEVLCPAVGGDRWDQHSDLKGGHENNARATDKPIAGLLKDLEARGAPRFHPGRLGGRVRPHHLFYGAQGSDGRIHNPYGFTMWLPAGGGIKGRHHLRRDR